MGDIISKIFETYGKEYVTWLMSMLTSPGDTVMRSRRAKADGNLGQYLLTVVLISIFLGATVGALIPGRPPMQEHIVVFVAVSLLWLFLSLLVHFFCRLIGGTENSQITMSLMAQDLAFVYVASNFLTLLIIWLAKAYAPLSASLAERKFFDEPASILFSLQFLLLLYFVPTTVSYAHGFRGFRWVMVAVFAATFAVLFGFPVYAQHSC